VPISFSGNGLLLDIEGTTSPIAFVYEVMFPYARRELDAYLETHWNDDATRNACEAIARDAGAKSLEAWCGKDSAKEKRARVAGEVRRLMDGDIKATGLKELQGLIWKEGFESGEMRARVYDDVVPALQGWCEAGRDIRIYSSGSVAAQKLFFGHSEAGDLLHFFKGYYDTKTGPKKEAGSYEKIAADFEMKSEDILFLSDSADELNAAREAGMATGLCVRPGNPPAPDGHGHPALTSFEQVKLA